MWMGEGMGTGMGICMDNMETMTQCQHEEDGVMGDGNAEGNERGCDSSRWGALFVPRMVISLTGT